MEVGYVATSETTKDVVWLRKFLMGLRVILCDVPHLVLFCDNNEEVA